MAALDRAAAETILSNRVGPLMTVAEMSLEPGEPESFDDPLAWATRGVGGSTANYHTVTDAELAAVPSSVYDNLMNLAEYRLLKNLQGALNAVDITTGPRSEKFSQFMEQVQKMLDRLEPTIEALGVLSGTLTAGYISLDFREHNEARL